MMQIKLNKNSAMNLKEFSGFISTKENRGIINLTRLVIAMSVFFAVLMIVSK